MNEFLRRPPNAELVETEKPSELLFGIENGYKDKAEELESFVEAKDFWRSIAILKPRLLETLIITKGDNGGYLQTLLKACDLFLDKIVGCKLSQVQSVEEFEKAIRAGVSSRVLVDAANCFYHLKDWNRASKIAQMVASSESDDFSLVDKAHALNCLASIHHGRGEMEESVYLNQQGLRLLDTEVTPAAPNTQWQRLKLQHGLLATEMEISPSVQTAEALLSLVDKREKLGDVAHRGRTYLDVARVYKRINDPESALHYGELALRDLQEKQYNSAALDAARLVGEIRRAVGQDKRAQFYFSVGLKLGEQLKEIKSDEMTWLKKEIESCMKRPATCLVEIAPDRYLLEVAGEHGEKIMCLTVDQEVSKNAKTTIREKVGAILNYLLALVDKKMSMEKPVTLGMKNSGVYIRKDNKIQEETEKNETCYSIRVDEIPQMAIVVATLDKEPRDRYTILSFEQLVSRKDDLDDTSRSLIELEEKWRQKAATEH